MKNNWLSAMIASVLSARPRGRVNPARPDGSENPIKVPTDTTPTLRQVLEKVASGYHDGTSTTIHLDHVTESLVTFHEGIHERIFIQTPDGILLSVLQRIVQPQHRASTQVFPAFITLRNELMNVSREAHETAATYLSIKQFSPSQQPATIGALPRRYRLWYERMADVLDPAFSSSYLQYIVGWTLAYYAFHSPLLRRFDLDAPEAVLPLHEEERPNSRLTCLLRGLDRSALSELNTLLMDTALQTCASLGCPTWDIHSEQDWEDNQDAHSDMEIALNQWCYFQITN